MTETAASFGADSSEGLAQQSRILNRASLGIEPPCERQLDNSQVSRLARSAFEDMLLLYEREEPLDHTGFYIIRAQMQAQDRGIDDHQAIVNQAAAERDQGARMRAHLDAIEGGAGRSGRQYPVLTESRGAIPSRPFPTQRGAPPRNAPHASHLAATPRNATITGIKPRRAAKSERRITWGSYQNVKPYTRVHCGQ